MIRLQTLQKPAITLSLLFGFCLVVFNAAAEPPAAAGVTGARLFGRITTTIVTPGESLMEVARREGYGFDAVVRANPDVDPWLPEPGTGVVLPGQSILPAGAGPGLTINLAEIRLYHLQETDHGCVVRRYPLGIGREGRTTPEGLFRIVNKQTNPYWHVPAGLRAADPSLPEIVPPGDDNPLGTHWLGLSAPGYGIHGTNRPLGVGRRISYGCLRMYPEDIAALYSTVKTGIPVRIVYQPVKAGWADDTLYMEVHPDYLNRHADLFQEALTVLSRVAGASEIDYSLVRAIVRQKTGVPVVIANRGA